MKTVLCLVLMCLLVGCNAQQRGQGLNIAAARGQAQGQGLFGLGSTGNLFAASGAFGNIFMKRFMT